MEKYAELFNRLGHSKFRSKFSLKEKDYEYIEKKSLPVIREHAYDFIGKRLAPEVIPNDGKQTPWRGHPVFVAQHATGCCCRECLFKWHKINKGKELTKEQQDYVVDVLMTWIENQMRQNNKL